MEYLDARRLPGPNLFWEYPGAVLDITCNADEADEILSYCEGQIRRMLDAVGWNHEQITHAQLLGGVSIAFTAPIDVLYSASAIAEWAWACCGAEFGDDEAPDFSESLASIREQIEEERNPSLLAIQAEAAARCKPFLWDDDEVTIGHGSNAETWAFRELPNASSVNWDNYRAVPTGIVTGTNGKTTSVRITKHILQSAGNEVGISCTDWVAVNDRIVDRDDWSGPGGARMALRQPGIDVAVLETARGGLLRRGLGIEAANAALITNIAEDHLGDYGSQSVQELLDIKWVVSHSVRNDGVLVLNADDSLLVEKAREYDGEIRWFSLDSENAVVASHLEDNGIAMVFDGNAIQRWDGKSVEKLCSVSAIPISMNGAALHNIANCMGAALLSEMLGATLDQVRHGLVTMDQEQNPGRSNVYDVNGFKALVDFAHNPEAMNALFAMARAIPAKRRVLCFGQAGDRTDQQIRELAHSAWSIGLDQVMVAELPNYLRGRQPRDVFDIIRDEMMTAGAASSQINYFPTEKASFDAALNWAQEGDLVVILDLGRDADIHATIAAMSG